jgi:nucleoporin SEH1
MVAALDGATDIVHDVAWAPNLGRSYHLIATASRDQKIRLYQVTEGTPLKVELLATLSDHHAEVWRVEWNVTGTVLISSGDDGRVRLWKANLVNEWKCLSILTADGQKVDVDL